MTQPTTDPFKEILSRLQRANRQEAMILLGDAADRYPTDPRPLLLLAAELAHAKQIDKAEAAYIGALQRAPGFAIARFQLGLLQLTSGRPSAAMATWGPLEALDDDDPLRLFKQGLEALAQDRFEDADRLIREGIAKNTTNPPLNSDMQKVLERMAQAGVFHAPPDARAQVAARAGDGANAHVLVSNYGRKP